MRYGVYYRTTSQAQRRPSKQRQNATTTTEIWNRAARHRLVSAAPRHCSPRQLSKLVAAHVVSIADEDYSAADDAAVCEVPNFENCARSIYNSARSEVVGYVPLGTVVMLLVYPMLVVLTRRCGWGCFPVPHTTPRPIWSPQAPTWECCGQCLGAKLLCWPCILLQPAVSADAALLLVCVPLEVGPR